MASCNSRKSEMPNFHSEISDMMHGFGDNPEPEPATVTLVESIVLRQLRSLLQEAYYISEKHGNQAITNYHIIFLMRRNISKLKQLQDYQISLDKLDKSSLYTSTIDDKVVQGLHNKAKPKLKRDHIAIIEQLDELNEVKHMKVNKVLMDRKLRAVQFAESIPLESYEAFHKARCSSFRSGTSHNKYAKLEQWLNPCKELKITPLAMEVIAFIAYETVAELVDGVLKIRQDANKKLGQPFSKLEGGFNCNPSGTPSGGYTKSGLKGCPKITVAEVREVVRRYFMPGGGMNGLFSRNMSQDVPVRFIAF